MAIAAVSSVKSCCVRGWMPGWIAGAGCIFWLNFTCNGYNRYAYPPEGDCVYQFENRYQSFKKAQLGFGDHFLFKNASAYDPAGKSCRIKISRMHHLHVF